MNQLFYYKNGGMTIMLEIISGTFENGCGVIIKDTKTNKYYHSLVYKDSIIIEGNTYYKEDITDNRTK